MCHTTFTLWSLDAIFFGDRFYASRNDRTRRGGGEVLLGLALVGTGWAISLLLCANGLR